jgi:N-acetylneuraminic acid mutarotase
LPNGKVLVTGGANEDGVLASAELYDPSTGTWSLTGNLNAPRIGHSATLLQNGTVLVAGGYVKNSCCQEGAVTHTAEIYDPGTGGWSQTGDLNIFRTDHTATLLSNGKVLVAGGGRGGLFSATNTAELYDAPSGTWSFTGNLNETRVGHTATLLRDGKVLVVSGCGDEECFSILGSAESYDPNTGAWSNTGGLNAPRYNVSATIMLPNGNVLVAAGSYFSSVLNSAELYNPATGRWSYTDSLLSHRSGATATLLPSGQVLVVGGVGYDSANPGQEVLNSAELYDPATGKWNITASLNTARNNHTATLLTNGKVLVVGGHDRGYLRSAELYDPEMLDPAPTVPRIIMASVSGKKLFITGENFHAGAVILLNGEEQKTKQPAANPQTSLIGKKAGRKIRPGDRVQVRNPDGTLSEEFIFTGS